MGKEGVQGRGKKKEKKTQGNTDMNLYQPQSFLTLPSIQKSKVISSAYLSKNNNHCMQNNI